MKQTAGIFTERKKALVAYVMGLVLWGVALPASAEPKGPNGEKCDSSETGVKHDIKGQSYTCDKCVYTKCDSSGKQISNCQTVTHWSNCVASIVTPGGKAAVTGQMQNVPAYASPQTSPTPGPQKFEGVTVQGNQIKTLPGYTLEKGPNNQLMARKAGGGLGAIPGCGCVGGGGTCTVETSSSGTSGQCYKRKGDTCKGECTFSFSATGGGGAIMYRK
ncbi:MAG TPA: hypothetical protein VMO00_08630 [Methylomirabilota bacterium]|nr:hypothetical protein [Methylomirabilota bacterium]